MTELFYPMATVTLSCLFCDLHTLSISGPLNAFWVQSLTVRK